MSKLTRIQQPEQYSLTLTETELRTLQIALRIANDDTIQGTPQDLYSGIDFRALLCQLEIKNERK